MVIVLLLYSSLLLREGLIFLIKEASKVNNLANFEIFHNIICENLKDTFPNLESRNTSKNILISYDYKLLR